jgi:hypothetical protein
VQRVLGEPILLPEHAKGALSFYLLRARNGPRALPGGIGPHAVQPSLPFGQDRVIHLPRRFQMRAHALRLIGGHLEREFQEKGRRPFARVRLLLCAGLPFPGHWMEASFSILFEQLNCCSMILHVLAGVKAPDMHDPVTLPLPAPNRNGGSSPG